LREDIRDGVDVARQPRDDPARLLLREVPERQTREVIEQVLAEAEHHPLSEPGEPADEHGLEQPAARRYEQIDDDDHRQVVLVAGADALVDRVANEEPAASLRRCVAGRDEDEPEGDELPSLEIEPEALHPSTSCNQVAL